MSGPAPLIYLDAAAVEAAMPAVEERLELARRTMVALVGDAELPPKLGVHLRAVGSITGAMPALLRGAASDGSADLLGIKWVVGVPGNRARGLPAINAIVIVNDALTGVPVAILDGGPITAQRTAAVSGVVVREWAPAGTGRVALIGAGVQGYSHVDVLAAVAPAKDLIVADRHADRAAALSEHARQTGRFGSVDSTTDPRAAVAGADVVLTMVSFGPDRQSLPAEALAAARLIVGVDYDMCVPADIARRARLFLTDDVTQFAATRRGGIFAGYPDPDASIGEALLGRAPAGRQSATLYVNHLGVGLADVVFANAIVRVARQHGLGLELQR